MSFAISPILSRYIGLRFLASFLLVFVGLLGVIYLIDSLELIRDLAKYKHLTFARVATMTALKLPETGLDLMPFAVLISAVFTFWRLTRTSELVVVRATGVSAWQFLFAPVVVGILLAIVKITVLNPVGAVMIGRFEQMEVQYISNKTSIVNVARTGLWLRQRIDDDRIAIIHADNVRLPEWILTPTTAFFFNDRDRPTHRIDAKSAQLAGGKWEFRDAWINPLDQTAAKSEPAFYHSLALPTSIRTDDIMSRFTSPRTIPFWNLPAYARVMTATGFESNPLWARFYGLLAEPFLNTALIIIAAALALRAPRMQKNWWLVVSTIAIGFVVFFFGDFLQALGISDRLPLTLAAFVPAIASLFMGLTALLYLEDG